MALVMWFINGLKRADGFKARIPHIAVRIRETLLPKKRHPRTGAAHGRIILLKLPYASGSIFSMPPM